MDGGKIKMEELPEGVKEGVVLKGINGVGHRKEKEKRGRVRREGGKTIIQQRETWIEVG